jgi:hypothetical protein
MLGRSAARIALAVFLAMVACRSLWAAPPWNKLVVFKRLEARPDEMYPISDSNGPWMIMATAFTGERAEDQARELIYELRKTYKLPAYSYRKRFEYSKPVKGLGLTPGGEQPLMKYANDKDIIEIAVLVGDYQSVDDPDAQKVLKRLKTAQPKSLANGKASSQSLAGFRELQRKTKEALLPKDSEDLKRGPLGGAFVSTNPLLPNEYFVPKGIDNFVLEMNKHVPHSLLDCPGKFTVRVATFTGHAIILDKKRQEAIEKGQVPKSYLEDAAKNAHTLTVALRQKGVKAYEYHDRSSSMVCVGSFESVGTRREDGKIDINPAVLAIMKQYGAETKVEPGKVPELGKQKNLAGVPFDVQPLPVEVPRRNLSNAYSRTADTR